MIQKIINSRKNPFSSGKGIYPPVSQNEIYDADEMQTEQQEMHPEIIEEIIIA